MITPKEIREKADRPFYKIVSSILRGETLFPWTIPSNKQISGSNYSDWKNDLIPLHQHSKESKGKGYSIEWKSKKVNGSIQSVPVRIYFETFDDYLHYTGKTTEFKKIEESREVITNTFPSLKDWSEKYPELLVKYYDNWGDIIEVCKYLINNKPPRKIYMRELPIPVHSKFVENNTAILKKLLDIILPNDWILKTEQDFASRYGFKRPNIHTQIRVLDDDLKPALGYEECSLPIEDAAWLKWLPQRSFIVENQICYLTFPKVKNSVAIFGEGFKSRLTMHIPWLDKTELYCWFDLDAAGFEMLNMIRQHYPNTSSLLMNQETFSLHNQFAVPNSSRLKTLPLLTTEERTLYEFLVANNLRLEQERIPQQYVLKNIK